MYKFLLNLNIEKRLFCAIIVATRHIKLIAAKRDHFVANREKEEPILLAR